MGDELKVSYEHLATLSSRSGEAAGYFTGRLSDTVGALSHAMPGASAPASASTACDHLDTASHRMEASVTALADAFSLAAADYNETDNLAALDLGDVEAQMAATQW